MLINPQLHSIWSFTKTDMELFSRRYLSNDESSLHAFFGPGTIVVHNTGSTRFESARLHIQTRFGEMRTTCNRGYGIVPISNTFTEDMGDESTYQFNAHELELDLKHWQKASKRSGKNANPPSPQPPPHSCDGDSGSAQLVLFQVTFPSGGRQALFQGVAQSQNGEPLSNLIGAHVVLAQDDGVDLGVLCAYEHLANLVRYIPEVPYMPVLRRALPSEVDRLAIKRHDEQIALQICNDLLRTHPVWSASMSVEHCEFQFDRHKLIVYAKMKSWLNFNAFVKTLHAELKSELGFQPRVFIQRRFVE